MESIGFKEWAVVCDALGRGEQTILLRKGGIAEGRNGFGFHHAEFFLIPTFFHEQVVKVRMPGAEIPAAGTKTTVDGAEAEVTSAVVSPASGEIVALAYVRQR